MTIPPELRQELQKIADLPVADSLEKAVQGHVNIADAKARGEIGSSGRQFHSAMIGCENLADAEKAARVYAKSLSLLGLVEEDKVTVLDWPDVFKGTTKADTYTAMSANLDRIYKEAEGGVLIISEPYQPPAEMTARDFAFSNYSATSHLMDKMDEAGEKFEKAFNSLYDKGKNIEQIERSMAMKNLEDPRKPIVIVIGRPFELRSMLSEDPHPWNMHFLHQMGLSAPAKQAANDAKADFGKPEKPPRP